MANLPKPLIGLLLGTVAFFAIWMVALKPSSSSTGGSPSGVGQYQSAINKAHQAVQTSNAANAKLGAPTATVNAPKPSTSAVSAPKSVTTAKAAPARPAKRAATAKPATAPKTTAPKTTAAKPAPAHQPAAAKPSAPSVASELSALHNAVANHEVVAVLFYNPASADDQAMKKELAAVPTHHGEVFTLAVPVSELTQFAAITAQVPVVTAPTLILIDPARQATTLTGFASQLELNQRVADALAAK
jgi:hypothetical protein